MAGDREVGCGPRDQNSVMSRRQDLGVRSHFKGPNKSLLLRELAWTSVLARSPSDLQLSDLQFPHLDRRRNGGNAYFVEL